jgi:hypothetical protein
MSVEIKNAVGQVLYVVEGDTLRGHRFPRGTYLGGANLWGMDISDCVFPQCALPGADLRDVIAKNARFVKCLCDGTRFDGADLERARLNVACTGTSFRNIHAPYSTWERGCSFAEGCSLAGAYLVNANASAAWGMYDTTRREFNVDLDGADITGWKPPTTVRGFTQPVPRAIFRPNEQREAAQLMFDSGQASLFGWLQDHNLIDEETGELALPTW